MLKLRMIMFLCAFSFKDLNMCDRSEGLHSHNLISLFFLLLVMFNI